MIACRRRHPVTSGQRLLGRIEALVKAVAAHLKVVAFDMGGGELVARHDDVAAPEIERIHTQFGGQVVHRGFDREADLAKPVAAERAGGNIVGVHRFSVDPLVGAAVDGDRFTAGMKHHAWSVVAVCAGVGENVDGQCTQGAVGTGCGGDVHPKRMTARCDGELIGTAELVADRTPGAQHRQCHEVLGEHLLLATKAAADAFGEHPHPIRGKPEHPGHLVADQKRHLRTGPQHQPAVVVDVADRGVSLQMHVLNSL